MKIIEYYNCKEQEYWLNEIKKSDWRAAQHLYEHIKNNELKTLCGENTKVLLLTEGDHLMSFCTYAEQDDVRNTSLTPWVGYVYTFPAYRGRRCIGKLLEYAYQLAREEGFEYMYISSDEEGLYEKYGFQFYQTMKNHHGEDTSVFRIKIERKDYNDILGKEVIGTIDRPIGSVHPKYPEIIYPVNYGYVDGVIADDGEQQDVYVFGTDQPLKTFKGTVISVYHRINDCEDKWIVSINGTKPSKEEILETISFQEQYFMGELYEKTE